MIDDHLPILLERYLPMILISAKLSSIGSRRCTRFHYLDTLLGQFIDGSHDLTALSRRAQ